MKDPEQILAVDEALGELSEINERAARLVELRFFAGLSEQQAAEALGLSRASISRDWRFDRLWLHDKLSSR